MGFSLCPLNGHPVLLFQGFRGEGVEVDLHGALPSLLEHPYVMFVLLYGLLERPLRVHDPISLQTGLNIERNQWQRVVTYLDGCAV